MWVSLFSLQWVKQLYKRTENTLIRQTGRISWSLCSWFAYTLYHGERYSIISETAFQLFTFEPQRVKTHLLTCVERRLKSACASAQSDQSPRCRHEETLHPLTIQKVPSVDSNQTERMCMLILTWALMCHVEAQFSSLWVNPRIIKKNSSALF